MKQKFHLPKSTHLVKTLKLSRVYFLFLEPFLLQDVFINVLAGNTGTLKSLAVVKVGMLEEVTQHCNTNSAELHLGK